MKGYQRQARPRGAIRLIAIKPASGKRAKRALRDHRRRDPNVRPGLLRGIDRGADRGAGDIRGDEGRLDPLPKVRPLWSPFGSRIPGVAYWLSRYPPGLLAYFESLNPPLLKNVLPE